MNDPIPPFIARINKVAEDCAVFRFATRDSELQKGACNQLEDVLKQIESEKTSAVSAGDEDYANALLGCECATGALMAEIRMWLLLKSGQPDEAWNALVAAQDALSDAMKAHKGFLHLGEQIRRLDEIERVVFPPQVFLSSGMIVSSQVCSICGDSYEDCPHVKGRPYMGEFCRVRLIPAELDHVSIVEAPADKRCRVIRFSAEGVQRNRMTWRIEPEDDNTIVATRYTVEE